MIQQLEKPNQQLEKPNQKAEIIYPDSDGEPMADNTKHFELIVTIKNNLDIVFADADVFVAGDLLWYPVEGKNTICYAPDVMVAFGRPKGHRGSYQQWNEDNIPPQVVFEIWSPGNRPSKMAKKFQFYQKYGVEEYYLYEPDVQDLTGWLRSGDKLEPIEEVAGWTSPRLGVRFEIESDSLAMYRPDGQRFLTYEELEQRAAQAEQRATQAEQQAEQAQQAEERATQAEQRATQAEQEAEQQAEQARQAEQRAAQAEARILELEARLRQEAIDPEQL